MSMVATAETQDLQPGVVGFDNLRALLHGTASELNPVSHMGACEHPKALRCSLPPACEEAVVVGSVDIGHVAIFLSEACATTSV